MAGAFSDAKINNRDFNHARHLSDWIKWAWKFVSGVSVNANFLFELDEPNQRFAFDNKVKHNLMENERTTNAKCTHKLESYGLIMPYDNR